MKVLSINSVPYGSTARVMVGISEFANSQGITSMTATGYSTHPIKELKKNNISIGNVLDKFMHMQLSKITGYNGCFSIIVTAIFLHKVRRFKPDIVHLHNLHCWYINIPLLMRYIKKNKVSVVWTFHDCWAFTGHCPHFSMIKCNKWKEDCYECPLYKDYPQSMSDNSKRMHKLKKKWFVGIEKMTIVTPSQWLADMVKQSFLKEYPVSVIYNGVDLSVFRPTESDFRARYKIPKSKKILVGVAFGWSEKKGLDVFIELAKRLDNEKYQIVLVGTDYKVDRLLPNNIISIHRTQNQRELAEIYTAANLFVNPTREEVLGMVNIEAMACGTPVLTFKAGGSPECIDETSGIIVECDDIAGMELAITNMMEDTLYSKDNCINRANRFVKDKQFGEYICLYEKIYYADKCI